MEQNWCYVPNSQGPTGQSFAAWMQTAESHCDANLRQCEILNLCRLSFFSTETKTTCTSWQTHLGKLPGLYVWNFEWKFKRWDSWLKKQQLFWMLRFYFDRGFGLSTSQFALSYVEQLIRSLRSSFIRSLSSSLIRPLSSSLIRSPCHSNWHTKRETRSHASQTWLQRNFGKTSENWWLLFSQSQPTSSFQYHEHTFQKLTIMRKHTFIMEKSENVNVSYDSIFTCKTHALLTGPPAC